MAGIEAATAPPLGPPAPTRRSGRAGPATPRGRLALAADAVVCCYHASQWACGATCAALIAARRACGNDSRAAAVAADHLAASVVAMTVFHVASLLLLGRSPETEALVVLFGGGGGATGPATQRRRPESTGARGRQDARRISVPGCIFLVSFVFLALGLVMCKLVPAKGFWVERIGYMLAEIGLFLYCVTFCYVKFPDLLIELRATYAKLKCGTTGLH